MCIRDRTMTDILSICEHYPAPALDTALNFLSTHDTERALTVIAEEPDVYKRQVHDADAVGHAEAVLDGQAAAGVEIGRAHV